MSDRRAGTSGRGLAAAAAELRAGCELRAAARAELLRGGGDDDGLAAARTELRAGGEWRVAARAHGLRAAPDAALRVGIEARDLIDLPHLLGGLIRGDVRLRGGRFLLEIRRAVLAQPARRVPAHLGTNPDATSRALMKLRLDLLDRLLERAVPLGSAQAVLHELAGLARGKELATAEQAAEPLRDLRAHAQCAAVERRAIAIAALVAMELELIAGVVAVIGVVAREYNGAHGDGIYPKRVVEIDPCAPVDLRGNRMDMVARGTVLVLGMFGSVASAQPRPAVPPVVGATEAMKLSAATGFIDDAITSDDQRLAYVVADGSAKAELHVVTLATKQETVIDLAPVTLHPIELRLVGARAFVVGIAEDGNQTAALVELAATSKTKPAGSVVYKVGPATHITVIMRDGKPRIAVHKATTTSTGTRHEVEIDSLETGKRIAAGRVLELDHQDASKALELQVNHWADGMTHAIGIKGGEWDRKENQRTPDVEATYDLVTGQFSDRHPIEDLFEQRKRFQTLADAAGRLDFVRMAWDNASIQLWRAGRPTTIEIDQPLLSYDPKSLQGVVVADGAWFTLKIDPVNAEAVARKKADPEYLDVFHVGSDGKAIRKARVLAAGVRHRFGIVVNNQFWLLERSSGFDRGGRTLTLYAL